MNDTRAVCLLKFIAAFALTLLAASASAQSYPHKPIRIVIPYPAGGGPDIVTRILTAQISPTLGQPFVMDYRPGGSATLGANVVAKAPADGYTLLATDHAAAIFGGALFKQLPYDPIKDLTIIAPVIRSGFVIAVGAAQNFTSIRELVADAKANPAKLQYGHSGIGTVHHLTMEIFKQRAGISMQDVPYKGAALMSQDLVGGQIPIGIISPSSAASLIKAGKLRAIAVTTNARMPSLPDVPAIAEVYPGFEAYSFVSLFAPSGTPREIIARLNGEIAKVLRDPEIVKKYLELGLEATPSTVEESNQLVARELALWPDVVRKLRISLD